MGPLVLVSGTGVVMVMRRGSEQVGVDAVKVPVARRILLTVPAGRRVSVRMTVPLLACMLMLMLMRMRMRIALGVVTRVS